MLFRRGFLKLLGAAIAVPWIGWPARKIARWSKWNLWIGGDDGAFDDPQCWSHRRVPGNGSSIVVDGGCVELPADVHFDNVALVGSGTARMEANTLGVAIDRLTISESYTGQIGEQGRTL